MDRLSLTAVEGDKIGNVCINVTLRRVLATIVTLEILCVCVCVSYPACNAHAPYCQLWPTLLYNIFPHYLIIVSVFEKKVR
jgi:hypothetical protein